MKKKLIFCISLILCVILCVSTIPFSAYTYDCPVEVTSRAALVANLDTDTFVYEKNSNGIRYLSYLTNVMTFIVARNNVTDINEKVEIKQSVLDAIEEPDNTLDKYVGKKLTVEDLLHYIMLTDGKDAAYVLADYVCNGDVEKFVSLMNKKARDLGCKKTKFVAPGIVKERTQYTTCHDMYKIFKCALDTPDFTEISGTVTYTPGNSKNKKKAIDNTNSLLKSKSPYFFTYTENGKYGADDVARGNLVALAEYNNIKYICIIFGAEVKSEHNAFTEAKQLYSWVYLYLHNEQIISKSTVLSNVDVKTSWGETSIELTSGKDIVRSVPDEFTKDMITIKVDDNLDIELPVFEGQNMGTAKLYYEGDFYEEIDLIANSSEGISMLEDLSGFVGSMFNATLVPSEEETVADETTAPTQKPTEAKKKSKTKTEDATQTGE